MLKKNGQIDLLILNFFHSNRFFKKTSKNLNKFKFVIYLKKIKKLKIIISLLEDILILYLVLKQKKYIK